MAFVTADRVKDTSTTTGTGNFTVSGTSPTGYRTFSAVLSAADTFYYCIQGQTTAEWEVGLGTYSSANVFARTTILSSSNSNLVVSFQAGVKNVFITLAAGKTLQIGPSSTPVAGSVPYGTGATLAYTAAGTAGQVLTSGGAGSPTWTTVTGTGTVTSVAQTFTGGIVSVGGSPITASGTLALTVAGTSGGIPYFSSGTTWASSAALTANGVVYGGGAAASPASTAAGTTGQVLIATTSNAPSWGQVSLTAGVTGSLPIGNGGTGQTTAAAGFNALSPVTTTGDLIVGNGTNSSTRLGIGSTSQVLTVVGGTAAWATPASGGVSTITFGSTGLTPSTATSGAVTVAGTLTVANGGTGLTTTPANGALDIGNGTGFTRTTLTAGSGITITNGAGSISIAASGGGGTVTLVSVTSANGVSGTVTNPSTTPAISLTLGDITPTSVALNGDTFITRKAAASLRFGAADAVTPVAQTLSVQSVVAGQTNASAAAYPFTINGSQGTGSGAGGTIVFQVAPAGGAGTAQNALASALTINSNRSVTFSDNIIVYANIQNAGGTSTKIDMDYNGVQFGSQTGLGISWGSSTNPSTSKDIGLYRDTVGALAQRQGTQAQEFRVYETTTGSIYKAILGNRQLIKISGAAFDNGAGASAGTMTNAPTAGNPTKWIPIDDNGTTRYIPAW